MLHKISFLRGQRVKELEDRTEQNRTEILLKTAQTNTSLGEVEGNKITTLEQLQEVEDHIANNNLSYMYFINGTIILH